MSSSVTDKYHYGLLTQNRVTVAEQGARINKSLKKLKKISYPDTDDHPSRRDEPTEQFVTLPREEIEHPILMEALEEAEKEYRQSTHPPPPEAPSIKKRWYRWRD